MTKKKKKNIKKSVIYAVAAVLLLVVALVILEKTHVTNFVKAKQPASAGTAINGPTPEQKQEEDAVNAANKQKAAEQDTSSSSDTGSGSATDKSIDLSAKQESNNTVTVFTKLYNYSNGSCTLTVTNGDASNSQTANVIYQTEYSICAGFSVPISGLGSGNWNIKLSVESDGTSISKSISFKVM